MTAPKRKLIEVALPLEKINAESAREKSIRHGHPSTLHLWWARRPLAAARAVLFAQLVDDPSSHPDRFPTDEAVTAERKRLHQLIEELVVWENSNNENLLRRAHQEILDSTGGNPPPILDPFAGGGAIPLEAQRLGLEAHASDLNPVAVLINKALIEIPPKFAGQPPVFPGAAESRLGDWPGATGLAEDVRRYGEWVRNEAEKRIGHHYPKAKLANGSQATVIAWIWARTVTCPNPACEIETPLVNSFTLSKRKGKEAHVVPVVNGRHIEYEIEHAVRNTTPPTFSRTGASCVSCETAVSLPYIRTEGIGGRLGRHLLGVVAEGIRRRHYLAPDALQLNAADVVPPADFPTAPLPRQALGFRVQGYGITSHDQLYTYRQQHLLTNLVELIEQVHDKCMADGATQDRAAALSVFFALWLGRVANRGSSQNFWNAQGEKVEQVFARNALPMIWVYSEANPFSSSSGNILGQLRYLVSAMQSLPARGHGTAVQCDAAKAEPAGIVIATDPPYYDNVPYADLSDFFYVWHRAVLRKVLPELYTTLLTPKEPELIAEPARSGSWQEAAKFFETGLHQVFRRITGGELIGYPFTIFYAFKQSETGVDGTASTGWETMLQALLDANAMVMATWPLRTERAGGLRDFGRNSLASSVVLACRRRPEGGPRIDRRGFVAALKREMPQALRELQQGAIAPVDLPQAAIGPGMAIFSRYSTVLEDDGSPMRVRTALVRINEMLDTVLSEQEGDFDPDTRFSLAWFRQCGFEAGAFGSADGLARARNASLEHLERAGILNSRAGKVTLLAPAMLPENWDPVTDSSLSTWEVVMHVARALTRRGVPAASQLLSRVPTAIDRDLCKELAFLIFALAEDAKRTRVAVEFNALGTAWNDIEAGSRTAATATQHEFDFSEE